MSTDANDAANGTRRWKKTAFALGIGGVAGFLGATGVMQVMETEAFTDLGASVEVAALVAMLYVLTAFAVGVGVVSPKVGASFLNVEDAEELQEQRAMLTYSSVGMAAAGVALGVVALAGAGGPIDPSTALATYIVLSVLAVWISLRSWKLQDELMRAVGRETASLSYYLILLIGGSWTLLAHLGFIAGPAPLDWLTMFWSILLLAAFIVIGKRGMLVMR